MIWWHVVVVMSPFAVLYVALGLRPRRDPIAAAEDERRRIDEALGRRSDGRNGDVPW